MLEGRIALVTGASRGIGRATARGLAAAGASVVINYKASAEPALALEKTLRKEGVSALAIQADVSDREAVDRMLEETRAQLGPVDILINNAGFVRDRLLLRMTEEDWKAVWDTDYAGSAYLARKLLPGMAERAWGRIVNLASVVGIAGNAGQANYAAAKGALVGLTQDLAAEAASQGVTVNCVAPGYIATDATAAIDQQFRDAWLKQVPAAREGSPEEVASAVIYLASPDAGYITGQCLIVDGGLLLARNR